MNNHANVVFQGPIKDKFDEICDKFDEILIGLDKDEVMSMLINYMAHGLLENSDNPSEEIKFWAMTLTKTLETHKNAGSLQ